MKPEQINNFPLAIMKKNKTMLPSLWNKLNI